MERRMAMTELDVRQEIFREIQSLADVVPEIRAGQLVAALGELCSDIHGRGLWDASDEELLEAVWQYRRGCEEAMVPPSQGRA